MASIDFGSMLFRNRKQIKRGYICDPQAGSFDLDGDVFQNGQGVLGEDSVYVVLNKYSFYFVDLNDPDNEYLNMFKEKITGHTVQYDYGNEVTTRLDYKSCQLKFELCYIVDRIVRFSERYNKDTRVVWQGISGVGIGDSFILETNAGYLNGRALEYHRNHFRYQSPADLNEFIIPLKNAQTFIEFQKTLDFMKYWYMDILPKNFITDILHKEWFQLQLHKFRINEQFHKETIDYVIKRKRMYNDTQNEMLVSYDDIIEFYTCDDLDTENQIKYVKNMKSIDANIVLGYDLNDVSSNPLYFVWAFRKFTSRYKSIKLNDMFKDENYVYCHNVLSLMTKSFFIERNLVREGVYDDFDSE